MDKTPDAVKVGGVGQGGCENQQNCWCLVWIDGILCAAKILWIFKKAVQLTPMELDKMWQSVMHVQLLQEVSLEVLGQQHLGCSVLRDMGIHLAFRTDDGEELVIPLNSFHQQLAIVPFSANTYQLLGLKPL